MTTSRVTVAPLISLTSAGGVHTSRMPVAADSLAAAAVRGCTDDRTELGALADGAGAAGGCGIVPAGSAAMVPSTVHANGPGPFLICACAVVNNPEIWYAWPASMSAMIP